MGDRVSISFIDGNGDESIALFNHWGGEEFPHFALNWFKDFKDRNRAQNNWSDPITRHEARVMMTQFLDFIGRNKIDRQFKRGGEIGKIETDENLLSSSYYFGKDKHDGDNSDNGHYVIHTDTATMEVSKRPMEDYE